MTTPKKTVRTSVSLPSTMTMGANDWHCEGCDLGLECKSSHEDQFDPDLLAVYAVDGRDGENFLLCKNCVSEISATLHPIKVEPDRR